MENGPAIFAGMVFCLFGGGLLAWIATSVRRHRPVAHGVSQVASVTVASLVSLASLVVGAWCFTWL
ncbi:MULTISPECIES: hypothetical protein [Streptomyces]|uniref:Secreted protein n=1 Tax=Streptomyces hirsutus TaxID=35620 RepID=A0ABZ1GQV3_9ACTN|nr:hypothetical protein [Streptomyces hirsutus]WSD08036.1 hypothetical protein OIE73_21360 [Streptomyces hirsutus]WTD18538.1 hypothetical protein OH738_18210 [Streptomyces hirsutus]WTD76558.1 hypothetical protein OHB56_23400 [Streptomyces sp. NBC_01635]